LIADTERLVALEARLPGVVSGVERPGGPPEWLALARLCLEYKSLPAAAARLYGEAFAGQLGLAQGLASRHRYDAACSAALASAGRGDAARLPAKARASPRCQALAWLRAELATWAALPTGDPELSQRSPALRHWQGDADLAAVRDPAALAMLPQAERAAWERLWADVADVQRRAEQAK
jgi:hypothetical protein